MKELFQERRQRFSTQCLKYLRYVFNDHFVLVLFVLLGFVLLQYKNLLEHFPKQPYVVIAGLALGTVVLLFVGRIATYLDPADTVYLLPKEQAVSEFIQQATKRSFLVWGSLLVVVEVFLYPLYAKLGLTPVVFGGYVFVLLAIKYVLHQKKSQALLVPNGVAWDLAVAQEKQRQYRILQFFALFTRVKGMGTSVKRRAYADGLLSLVKNEHKQTWDYLYLRAFLRTGDFFSLGLRLGLLSCLCLIAIQESWLAVGLALVFDYLFLFQLLALYHVYDYQYMTQLYPLGQAAKQQGCQRVIRLVGYGYVGVQFLVSVVCLQDKWMTLVLLGVGVVFYQLYLPLKVKKLID